MTPRKIYVPQDFQGNLLTGVAPAQSAGDVPNLSQVSQLVQAPSKLANSSLAFRQLIIEFARAKGAPIYMVGSRGDGFQSQSGIDPSSNFTFTAGKITAPSSNIDQYTTGYLDFDGSTIADGVPGHTITTSGSPAITAASKFGAGALNLPGSAYVVDTATGADFDLQNGAVWTIDFWLKLNAYADFQAPLGLGNNLQIQQVNSVGNGLRFNDGTTVNGVNTAALTLGTWYKVELGTDGTNYYFFLNGALAGTVAKSSLNNLSTGNKKLVLGANGAMGQIVPGAVLDQVRVSKGICRHTAAYTVETAPPGMGVLNFKSSAPLGQPANQPVSASALLLANILGSPVLNTDIILSVSRDGGATYLATSLVSQGLTEAGESALTADIADLSGAGTGKDIRWKVTTTSGTSFALTGAMFSYF